MKILAAFTRYNTSVSCCSIGISIYANFGSFDSSQASQHTAVLIEQESLVLDNLSCYVLAYSGLIEYFGCSCIVVSNQNILFKISVIYILFCIFSTIVVCFTLVVQVEPVLIAFLIGIIGIICICLLYTSRCV